MNCHSSKVQDLIVFFESKNQTIQTQTVVDNNTGQSKTYLTTIFVVLFVLCFGPVIVQEMELILNIVISFCALYFVVNKMIGTETEEMKN